MSQEPDAGRPRNQELAKLAAAMESLRDLFERRSNTLREGRSESAATDGEPKPSLRESPGDGEAYMMNWMTPQERYFDPSDVGVTHSRNVDAMSRGSVEASVHVPLIFPLILEYSSSEFRCVQQRVSIERNACRNYQVSTRRRLQGASAGVEGAKISASN